VASKTVNSRAQKDDGHLSRIETKLRNREAGFWMRTLVKFVTGVPVTGSTLVKKPTAPG
jgi:hypothetical protein